MPAIQVDNPLYEQLRTRAANAGYASVDEYVADMLREDLTDAKNLDHLFTPERIAKLDQIVENIEAGGPLYTREEVDAHFKSRRDAWRNK